MKLLVAGGDRRHALLCELAAARGWHVMSLGLDGRGGGYAGRADAAVLPMPYIREGFIPAPLSDEKIRPQAIMEHIGRGTRIFCGRPDDILYGLAERVGARVFDLYSDEAFTRRNALLSAEGAIFAAMRSCDEAITGSDCLVIGFGRVGQLLAMQLKGLGACVCVADRNAAKRAQAECMGFDAVDTAALNLALRARRFVFNTVPAMLLDGRTLAEADAGALIIETASPPYGVDFDAARELGLRVLKESGIPGRYCPRTAAGIILDAVENLTEVN